ncbi:MAG: acyl-CoA reductase [Bacteroidales bacterium]|jgi:hypothetical protein|nr:acyl-CoA reductase [Bacteroidales bacterium]
MTLSERIQAFSELGQALRDSLSGNAGPGIMKSGEFNEFIETRQIKNSWFTPGNVRLAVSSIASELTPENLKSWCDRYPQLAEVTPPRKIGVVMAGNIPLVGFHDMLSVLITGNSILAKISSRDAGLTQFLASLLGNINPEFKASIEITEDPMRGFDAVIATGSDNSSRYFEYYFGRYPHIIRKNRNSVAVLSGNETVEQLEGLGDDIFSYFGLGCRNVSRLFLPAGYDPLSLAVHWIRHASLMNHSVYANNYDFNKAVYLVNRDAFTDTGFLLFRENAAWSSPVAVLHYTYYETENAVKQEIAQNRERIQCIAGSREVPFGMAQAPRLWDYADGTDTIEFLLKKNRAGIL